MCCKLVGVHDLPDHKPVNTWCQHCDKKAGCQIYEDRPETCREFACMWLLSQERPNPMGLALRPDKSKVVLAPHPDEDVIIAHIDPAYPFAWREKGMGHLIERLAYRSLKVVLSTGLSTEKKVVTRRPGLGVGVETLRFTEPDADGMQWHIPDER